MTLPIFQNIIVCTMLTIQIIHDKFDQQISSIVFHQQRKRFVFFIIKLIWLEIKHIVLHSQDIRPNQFYYSARKQFLTAQKGKHDKIDGESRLALL